MESGFLTSSPEFRELFRRFVSGHLPVMPDPAGYLIGKGKIITVASDFVCTIRRCIRMMCAIVACYIIHDS